MTFSCKLNALLFKRKFSVRRNLFLSCYKVQLNNVWFVMLLPLVVKYNLWIKRFQKFFFCLFAAVSSSSTNRYTGKKKLFCTYLFSFLSFFFCNFLYLSGCECIFIKKKAEEEQMKEHRYTFDSKNNMRVFSGQWSPVK